MDSTRTTPYRNLKKSASSSVTSSNASGKNKDGQRNEETSEVVSEITPMLPPIRREATMVTINKVIIFIHLY